jgi:hypothetical protein
MIQQQLHFFSPNDIQNIIELNNTEIQYQKKKLINSTKQTNQTKFQLSKSRLPESVIQKLTDIAGISLQAEIPFRWIYGNTLSHVDHGTSSFLQTNIVYLTDCDGEFRIGEELFSIDAGHWYQFQEGVEHSVDGCSDYRLCLGPFNEKGLAVGCPSITYYLNSSLENVLGSTYFCGVESAFFADSTIIPPENFPENSTFLGWYLYEIPYDNGLTPEYSIGEIIQPGSPYNNSIDYRVYPFWSARPPSLSTMHFTNNAAVYYKPGSLAPGGVGCVRNSRHKAKRI